MDLEKFIGHKELLERLSREYELLKASGAVVDYPAWVRQRLREAAAELAVAKAPPGSPSAEPGDTSVLGGASGVDAEPADGEGAGPAVSEPAGPRRDVAPKLTFSRFPKFPKPAGHQDPSLPRASLEVEGPVRPEGAWFLRGEGMGPGPSADGGLGTGSASQALASAIFGPRATVGPGGMAGPGKGTKKTGRRVVVVSPQRSPLGTLQQHTPQPRAAGSAAATHSPVRPGSAQRTSSTHHPGASQRPPSAPPLSKLYTRTEPGLFSARPDAYVHPPARPKGKPPAAQRPDWVNAASLQAALKAGASAVPHLQAAAERERRLALSAALARQSLAAGLAPDEARSVALHGMTPAAAAAAQAQYDHVLLVAQQLAAQNEHLTRAVHENSAQLAQQAAMIESALHGGPGSGAPGGPHTALVEVETGPPAWFTRRGPAGATGTGRGGRTARSPAKSTATRGAATGSPYRVPPPPTFPPTAKAQDQASRKDALKALLKQVLGGAGLAGGAEGRRRLASGMAEAEKLVAAIHALAKIKSGGAREDVEAGGAEYPEGVAMLSEAQAAAEAVDAAAADADAAAAAGGGGAVGFGSFGGFGVPSPEGAAAPGSAGPSPPGSRPGSRKALGTGTAEGEGEGGVSAEAEAGAGGGAGGSGGSEGSGDGSAGSLSLAGDLFAGAAGRDAATGAGGSGVAVGQPGGARGGSPGVHAGMGTPGGRLGTGPFSLAGGGVRGGPGGTGGRAVPPGVMVESLEDQVAQIVERDAAAAAEAARLHKLDRLEQRLNTLVDRVEGKLSRALQPLQLNGGTPAGAGAGAAGGEEWEWRVGPDGKPVLVRKSGGAGVAGAKGGRPGADGDAPLSPRSASLSVLELQQMLIQLNRMDSKEAEIRRKWFHGSQLPPCRRGALAHPIVVRDGVVGTLDPSDPKDPPTDPAYAHRPAHPHGSRSPSPASPAHRPGAWGVKPPGARASSPPRDWPPWPHPLTESNVATVGVASSLQAHPKGPRGQDSMAARDGSAEAAEAGVDPIGASTLESVLRGKRRFLRAQQLADGDLVAAADPRVNPVMIMEDVTDALLDELLWEQAKELLGVVDALGDRIVKDEVLGERQDDLSEEDDY
ncbi:hypothetical protein HYH03_003905 [Edaphochlamys debaryana]|uniref:Uncharacterized protein n=1 Tax=Edaphochlamys debaryana TaxID=47281 RepID=A0A836C3V4_9CHLO|nr:hypothetical protein HYH03_003905 [Edaphochlamys debaryana]|eukprot:KAG2498147.1 hypothetical protein HYH03_003905 [Edaphochlamys debaryana]